MRNLAILLIIAFLSISFAGLAEGCVDLKAAKASYLPRETVQIEINSEATRTITTADISIYRNSSKLPTAVFLSKISDAKYFSWFDIPSQPGTYIMKVRGSCPDLRTFEISIDVQGTASTMQAELKSAVKDRWKTLSLESHALAAGVFSGDEISIQATSDYMQRSDSCVNSDCSPKNAALALAAFSNSYISSKMLNALKAYRNSINGEWQVQINSQDGQKCSIKTANATKTADIINGSNKINITEELKTNLSAISVELECEKNASAELVYSYSNFSKKYSLNDSAIVLDNSGCWGSGFKTACDSENTAYALLALAMTGNLESGDANAIAWLKNNAKNAGEKAIIYYITKDSIALSEIAGLQDSGGFWRDENSGADAKSTALAFFAMKNSNESTAVEKARAWLKSQKFSLSDKCFVLFFDFPASETEPILSVWPGLIKTSSRGSFSIILTNKGANDISATASLFESSTETTIGKNGMKGLQFKMPLATTTDGRAIFSSLSIIYSDAKSSMKYSYSIPLMIFTEKGVVDQIGAISVNATENIINSTEQQEIINGTGSSPLENKTADANVSLLQEKFAFAEKNISRKADSTDGKFQISITLANHLDGNVTDIEISPQINLQQNNFVTVNPTAMQSLGAGKKANVTVYINPAAADSQAYRGYIQASGKYKGTVITSYIPVDIEITGSEELLSCGELGGADCSEENQNCGGEMETSSDISYCCVPADKCTKKTPAGRSIGLIIVLVIVVILIVILLILKRRPKKEMKEFLEEKAKEYELKKTQRPSSIKRDI